MLVDSFFDNLNREGCFDSQDMDGVSLNYRIVFASSLPPFSSVNDLLDNEGTLVEDVNIINVGDDGLVALSWNKGVNIGRTMACNTSSILVDLGDVNVAIQGVFLVDNATGFVIAYNVQDKSIRINKEQAVFPLTGLVMNIHEGVER